MRYWASGRLSTRRISSAFRSRRTWARGRFSLRDRLAGVRVEGGELLRDGRDLLGEAEIR
jgi:hypothetical protein